MNEEVLLSQYIRAVTAEEGEALLKRLPELDREDCKPPRKMRRHCLRAIRRGKSRTAPLRPVRFKALFRVALVAVLCAALVIAAVADTPELPTTTMNFMVKHEEKSDYYWLEPKEGQERPIYNIIDLIPEWIPEGYEQTYSYKDETSVLLEYDLKEGTGRISVLAISATNPMQASTECSFGCPIVVQEDYAMLYTDDPRREYPSAELIWPVEASNAFISIVTDGMYAEENAVEFAEHLKIITSDMKTE